MENNERGRNTLRVLIFDENSHILCDASGVLNIDMDQYGENWDREVYEKINHKYGIHVGVGDVVYMNDDHGSACLGFVDVLTAPPAGFEYKSYTDGCIEPHADEIYAGLVGGLMNPYQMRPGYCYMNQVTGECYHVITIIADSKTSSKLYVVECNLSTLPMVLPADMFVELPMLWIPHAKYVREMEFDENDIVEKARRFFITAHNDTLHFYGNKPYSMHTAGVVQYHRKYRHLIPEKDWDVVEASLWGHDSIEDDRLTYNNVKEVLGQQIAEGAYVMTNEKGRTRGERANKKYYDDLAAHEYGEYMKLCDRLFNMRNSVETGHGMAGGYSREMEKFEQRLRTHGDTYASMWDELKTFIKVNETA